MNKRKFISNVLAATLAFSSLIPAFASAPANITIEGKGAEYKAYQILNLTTSLKAGDHDHADANHGPDCYNYSYTVNGKYQSALQKAVPASADTDGTAGLSDKEILAYLNGLSEGDHAADVRSFADKMWEEVRGMEADSTANSSKQFVGVGQGYYLIAETAKDGDPDAISLVMLDTSGQNDITVKSKEGVPTVSKEVMETNDDGEAGWGEVADADIGDHVKFKLEGTMPSLIDNYKTYKYIFHDDLSAGLTLDVDSVKVTVDGAEATDYTLKTSGLADEGCDFEVVFDNIKAGRTVTADTKVVVEYTATLNGDAVLKNNNSVKLEFSNNPYNDGESSTTPSDDVSVFTFTLDVNKIDKEHRALAGAHFKVQKWDAASGKYVDYNNGTIEENKDATKFVFKGLDAGKYQLVETKVPDGYNAIDPIEFEITSEYEGQELASLTANPESFVANATNGVVSTDIVNETGSILPSTGGEGTYLLYGAGAAILLAGGATLVISQRKKSGSKVEN